MDFVDIHSFCFVLKSVCSTYFLRFDHRTWNKEKLQSMGFVDKRSFCFVLKSVCSTDFYLAKYDDSNKPALHQTVSTRVWVLRRIHSKTWRYSGLRIICFLYRLGIVVCVGIIQDIIRQPYISNMARTKTEISVSNVLKIWGSALSFIGRQSKFRDIKVLPFHNAHYRNVDTIFNIWICVNIVKDHAITFNSNRTKHLHRD